MNTLPLPPKLPETVADFRNHRKLKSSRTLNDMVEEIHLMLYEDDDYQRFLYAVYDEQAVEGSLAADNIMAAGMIRDKAAKVDKFHPLLTGNDGKPEKLATISKALGVVLRRYNQSRRDRRDTVGGEVVHSNNGE